MAASRFNDDGSQWPSFAICAYTDEAAATTSGTSRRSVGRAGQRKGDEPIRLDLDQRSEAPARERTALDQLYRLSQFRCAERRTDARTLPKRAPFPRRQKPPHQHGVRRELVMGYDLEPAKAERMLEHIKADVERGIWKAPEARATSAEPEDPTFWEFASDWWAHKRKQELAERSEEWYEWALKKHLLPYAHEKRLSDFDSPKAVEDLRDHLLDKRWPADPARCPPGKTPGSIRLSARSVNQILSVFSAVVESATERGHVSRNWAATKGKRAKTKRRAKTGSWVDYEPLVALLDAAHEIDLTCQRADTRNTGRRALLACLFLGAMRISEVAQLQRRDVKWSRAVVHIPASKTAAGIARDVPMHQMFFSVMSEWWGRHPTRARGRSFSRLRTARDATATTSETAC